MPLSKLRTLKTILIVVFGVPSMLCVGGVVISETFWGDATVAVVAPDDADLTLEIGDTHKQLVPAGEHLILDDVPQGETRYAATFGGQTQEGVLDLGSGFDGFLIVLDGQCLVQTDVTEFFYRGANKDPHIEARFEGPQVAEYQWSSVGFDEDSLPTSIPEYGSAYMIQQVPCNVMQAMPDEKLLILMGWTLPE